MNKVPDIVGYQRICPPIDSDLKDHVIVGVRNLGTPLKTNLYRFDRYCQIRQEPVNLHDRESMHQAMFRPRQNLFVFQKERRTCQDSQLPRRHHSQ